jgi:hypothetical protein
MCYMQQLLKIHIKSYYPNRPGPGNFLIFKKMLSFTDLQHSVLRYPPDRFRKGILLCCNTDTTWDTIPHSIKLCLQGFSMIFLNSIHVHYAFIWQFSVSQLCTNYGCLKVTIDVNLLPHLFLILRNRTLLFFMHFSKENEVSFMFSSKLPLDNINYFFIKYLFLSFFIQKHGIIFIQNKTMNNKS